MHHSMIHGLFTPVSPVAGITMMLVVGKVHGPSSPVCLYITSISITPDAPNPLTSNSLYPVFPSSHPILIPILSIVYRWTPLNPLINP
jgi:hypothetical protein